MDTETVDEQPQQSDKVEEPVVKKQEILPRWALITIVAAFCGLATAGTVFYIRHKRREEEKAQKYGALMYQSSEFTESKMKKYWNITTSMFINVKNMIGNMVSRESSIPKMAAPIVEQATYQPTTNINSDAEM